MDNFEKELKAGFIEEANQLMTDMESAFLELENNSTDSKIIETIFRLAHNIKGSSKAVGFSELGQFTHEFENLLLKFKKNELKITQESVTLLLQCSDHLKMFIEALKNDLDAKVDSSQVIAMIHNFSNSQTVSDSSTQIPSKQSQAQAEIKIESKKTEPQYIIESKHIQNNHVENKPVAAKNVHFQTDSSKNILFQNSKNSKTQTQQQMEESLRVSTVRLEKLINYIGEMSILQTVINEQAYSSNMNLLRRSIHQMNKVVKEIQDISMSLRMVPVKPTFQKMQRIVRDTSTLLNKKVKLITEGEDTELDKTVLERIGDPLVHIIRNAVDHGIESAEKRAESKKDETGTVILKAYYEGDKLVIEVKDDGGGIDGEKLRKKAIEKGIISPDKKYSEDELVNLIFHPGFSTKAEVTEVSGRGVGMDVVKTNIEQLQGEVKIFTEVGKGSTFKIMLPLTLAIIDAMIVSVEGIRYIVPLSHINETVRLDNKNLQYKSGLGEILILRDENIPSYRLSGLLKMNRKELKENIALVIRVGEQPFSILVDDIMTQQQVVIKKLGVELQGYKGFIGSSILGDGKPALILDVVELVKTTNNYSIAGRLAV